MFFLFDIFILTLIFERKGTENPGLTFEGMFESTGRMSKNELAFVL